MSTPFVIPTGRMLRDAGWLFDRDLEAADAAADAAYDRRCAIERSITDEEILEELAAVLTGKELMTAYLQYSRGMPKLQEIFDAAIQRLVEQKEKELSLADYGEGYFEEDQS
jgi:hypothetical protein